MWIMDKIKEMMSENITGFFGLFLDGLYWFLRGSSSTNKLHKIRAELTAFRMHVSFSVTIQRQSSSLRS